MFLFLDDIVKWRVCTAVGTILWKKKLRCCDGGECLSRGALGHAFGGREKITLSFK